MCVWASDQTPLLVFLPVWIYIIEDMENKPNDCDATTCSASLACVQETPYCSNDPMRRIVPGPWP